MSYTATSRHKQLTIRNISLDRGLFKHVAICKVPLLAREQEVKDTPEVVQGFRFPQHFSQVPILEKHRDPRGKNLQLQNEGLDSVGKQGQVLQRAEAPRKPVVKRQDLEEWVSQNLNYTCLHTGQVAEEKARLVQLFSNKIAGKVSDEEDAIQSLNKILTERLGGETKNTEKVSDLQKEKTSPASEQTPQVWSVMGGPFTQTSGLTSGKKRDAENDLPLLCDAVANGRGNIYSTNIQTVVGGNKFDKEKYGLNNKDSRIDVQNPPGNGVYSIHYQLEGASICGVLFTDEDSVKDIMQELEKAMKTGPCRVSPTAAAILQGKGRQVEAKLDKQDPKKDQTKKKKS